MPSETSSTATRCSSTDCGLGAAVTDRASVNPCRSPHSRCRHVTLRTSTASSRWCSALLLVAGGHGICALREGTSQAWRTAATLYLVKMVGGSLVLLAVLVALGLLIDREVWLSEEEWGALGQWFGGGAS